VVIRFPSPLGGACITVAAVAAGLFFFVGMQAVRRGEAPPRLPTARQVGRRVLRHRRGGPHDETTGDGTPGPAAAHDTGAHETGAPGTGAPDAAAPQATTGHPTPES
jgi:hypothetical protein